MLMAYYQLRERQMGRHQITAHSSHLSFYHGVISMNSAWDDVWLTLPIMNLLLPLSI